MAEDVMIELARSADGETLASLNALIPQLSSSARPLEVGDLKKLIDDGNISLLLARDRNGEISGTLTLVTFSIPTGIRAIIEDVVVDGQKRGMSIGAKLVDFALDLALSLGAKTVDLTSRPDRESANRLYLRKGFQIRETNVYRFSF
ncbi:GNAT family N-acetyltransferase [Acidithrix ferrooxidans]|uniref:Aminoalkylphosphonic acid N-acetyltransferase n=1 Tax=Acidithrix ferrooxidans TaxID=1280514 RepID=A0A0D8HJT5_9ACTN|nr:GNAT family N-acetyltransferase [Acidithrix ferrooxidans]KJF17997.1 aminoalkylphosphonic acid N-acetyltransferase [Acidithrix ferrooxidans]